LGKGHRRENVERYCRSFQFTANMYERCFRFATALFAVSELNPSISVGNIAYLGL